MNIYELKRITSNILLQNLSDAACYSPVPVVNARDMQEVMVYDEKTLDTVALFAFLPDAVVLSSVAPSYEIARMSMFELGDLTLFQCDAFQVLVRLIANQ